MTQMQDKILAKLENITEAHGLDFVERAEYSNRGTVYVQADDFETVVQVRYDFQDTYVIVELQGTGVARSKTALADRGARRGTPPEVKMMLYYGRQADMLRLFSVFTAILTECGFRAGTVSAVR